MSAKSNFFALDGPKPEWIFFDVGNVLMDETPWIAHYHEIVFEVLREMVPTLTRERFDEEKWNGGVRKDVTIVQHLLAHFLSDDAVRAACRKRFWDQTVGAYYDMGVPAEGIYEVLDRLAPRYRLGIIANQHPTVHDWMVRTDLARYFPLAVYDCDFGPGKPDPRIFLHALQRAGCPPERAVMIGDRLDNDILPAKRLGMATIHLRAFGDYARREPSGPADTPDAAVSDVRDIPAAIAAMEEISHRIAKKAAR